MKNDKSGLARIAIAAPDSSCGGGAWSSDQSRHKYASNPPSKKGTRIKRSIEDQFCTHKGCSEPSSFQLAAGQSAKFESGYSVQFAPDKTVLCEYRKSQRDFHKKESWGIPVSARRDERTLTNSKAAHALQVLAVKKQEKREAKQEKREAKLRLKESRRKLENEILASMARALSNVKPSRKSDAIFSIGNAFAGL